MAKETIRAAKRAGADAIKLQTYTADTITIDCRKDDSKSKVPFGKIDTYTICTRKPTRLGMAQKLLIRQEEGLVCFSTPFDKTAVDFLETLDNRYTKSPL